MDKTKDKKAARGIAYTLIGAIAWGFSGACGQFLFANYEIQSGWLTTVRMTVAGLILLAASAFRNRPALDGIWKDRKDRLRLLLFAICGLMFCQYAYLTAVSYTNAGTATVLQYIGPVIIIILVCLRSLKLPNLWEGVSIILALLGTFLLATHGDIHTMALSPAGLTWGLVSAVGLASYTLLPGNLIKKWGSMVVTGYGMLIGGCVLGLISRAWRSPAVLDTKGWFFFLYGLIVIGTVISFSLYLQGVSDIGAVKASMLASVEPVSAALFAAFWLKSSFVWIDLAGFACILATVFLLTKKDTAAPAQPKPDEAAEVKA